jgi:ABC-type siderophore export system fused ATPase/permease subunit
MELLVYVANSLYLVAYAVRDILHLRMLTIVATCCLAVYFYNQVQPMMTVVYWNIFFVALNAIQLSRIYRERSSSAEDESSDAEDMTPVA